MTLEAWLSLLGDIEEAYKDAKGEDRLWSAFTQQMVKAGAIADGLYQKKLLGNSSFAEHLSALEAKCAELKKNLKVKRDISISNVAPMDESVKKDLVKQKESRAWEAELGKELQRFQAREAELETALARDREPFKQKTFEKAVYSFRNTIRHVQWLNLGVSLGLCGVHPNLELFLDKICFWDKVKDGSLVTSPKTLLWTVANKEEFSNP